jgi:hypothetical protein
MPKRTSPEALSYFPQPANYRAGPDHYLDLIGRAVEAVAIPIFASLNATTDEGWIGYAKQVEEAGVKGIELNVYFIPSDLSLTGREVEQRCLDILCAVTAAVAIPVALKLSPYFSAVGHMAKDFDRAGAAALVLFNRFYQPDIDLSQPQLRNDLQLSERNEIRLPLLWIAVLSGRISASLAANTGVESSEQVLKHLLAGADVAMTTSALPQTWRAIHGERSHRPQILAVGPRNRLARPNQRRAEPQPGSQPGHLRARELHQDPGRTRWAMSPPATSGRGDSLERVAEPRRRLWAD